MERTRLPKGEKVWLIILGIVLVFDVFCLIASIALNRGMTAIVANSMSTFNMALLCWIYYQHTKVVMQRNELQAKCAALQVYANAHFKYMDNRYDWQNRHGRYGIIGCVDCFIVEKYCEDCTTFFVKVFKFDPADEDGKATAKSKAEELLNLITENGKLWQ